MSYYLCNHIQTCIFNLKYNNSKKKNGTHSRVGHCKYFLYFFGQYTVKVDKFFSVTMDMHGSILSPTFLLNVQYSNT